jgi:hypothetical protein
MEWLKGVESLSHIHLLGRSQGRLRGGPEGKGRLRLIPSRTIPRSLLREGLRALRVGDLQLKKGCSTDLRPLMLEVETAECRAEKPPLEFKFRPLRDSIKRDWTEERSRKARPKSHKSTRPSPRARG